MSPEHLPNLQVPQLNKNLNVPPESQIQVLESEPLNFRDQTHLHTPEKALNVGVISS